MNVVEGELASSLSSDFSERGYAIYEKLLSRDLLDVAFRYYTSYVGIPGFYRVYEYANALDRYADALSEALLPNVGSALGLAIGKTLLPTYSYARIYTTESTLPKHIDHGACEISATLTVGHRNSNGIWPIFLERDGQDIPVHLDIGDALIYRGIDLPHWRNPLPSGIWCQMFFHFVAADGPMRDRLYNGREKLGPTPWEGPVPSAAG
ncbi:hypothetical protein [Dyella mobilis]|uniref:Uncharacterized protein n=1 Tax=Dyella mobilis TaxID=1849582 RepID=A0ABS2KMF5_9GAMM|nr:hypothetical protein [Dyella mobilis]MBM7132269.1 hypothetical protein [Dyella mobilis]GLQ95746.1 hypothetical protein GCM10007863_01640 [Dyella mobilis]